MQYFKSLTQSDLVALIKATKEKLFISMPAMHKDLVDAVLHLKNNDATSGKKIQISVLMDFDAQTFRQGYGNFEEVQKLMNAGTEVKKLKDNRISFIISDTEGYYLFIESRTLIPAEKETINAVQIDPVSIVRLMKFFFADSNINLNFQDELSNAIIKESINLENSKEILISNTAPVTKILGSEKEDIQNDLLNNPPLKPDYKRIVEIYSNKFQYVKLRFEGVNIKTSKINIPSAVLPIKNNNFSNRLKSKLELFDSVNDLNLFEDIRMLDNKVAELRTTFLFKVKSREESLLEKNRKTDFQKEVLALQDELEKVRKNSVKKIDDKIITAKKDLRQELEEFFISNPDELQLSAELSLFTQEDIEHRAEDRSHDVVRKIKWPNADNLLDKMKLLTQYSDITFEDLTNSALIKELKEAKLLTDKDDENLATFRKAVPVEK